MTILSIAQKLHALHDKLDTDVADRMTEWEYDFISDNHDKLLTHGGDTTFFSGKVCDKIDQLHSKFC